MKRKTAAILLILAVVGIAGIIWWNMQGRQLFKKEVKNLAPKIHISSLNITEIDDDKILLQSTTTLENPLPADLKIHDLYFELFIDNSRVLKTRYPKDVLIRKSDSAKLILPLELRTDVMKEIVEKFDRENRDSANYTLNADMHIKVPVAGKRKFDVNVTKRLPAIRGIQITPGKLNIDHVGLKDSELDMELVVENRNPFYIKLRNAKYTVKVENDLELEGTMEKMLEIPPRSRETITMNMKFKTAKVPKLGWKMLFRKKETNFVLDFSAKVVSDLEMLKNSTTKMHAEGTMDELMSRMKK